MSTINEQQARAAADEAWAKNQADERRSIDRLVAMLRRRDRGYEANAISLRHGVASRHAAETKAVLG